MTPPIPETALFIPFSSTNLDPHTKLIHGFLTSTTPDKMSNSTNTMITRVARAMKGTLFIRS